MKIKRYPKLSMTLEEFAEKHDLTLEVSERDTHFHGTPAQFWARFENSETKESKESQILSGTSGDGANELEAIRDYTRKISGKLLVIDAMRETRREIQVPILEVSNA